MWKWREKKRNNSERSTPMLEWSGLIALYPFLKDLASKLPDLKASIERYKRYSIYINIIENTGVYEYVVLESFGSIGVESIKSFIEKITDRKIKVYNYVKPLEKSEYKISVREPVDAYGFQSDSYLVIPCVDEKEVKEKCINRLNDKFKGNNSQKTLIRHEIIDISFLSTLLESAMIQDIGQVSLILPSF